MTYLYLLCELCGWQSVTVPSDDHVARQGLARDYETHFREQHRPFPRIVRVGA